MNINQARQLYSELHGLPEDNYLLMITNSIREAIVSGKYYVVFAFKQDDTRKTITDVCKALNDLGYSYASNLEFSPIRLTIYGWVQ
jgi:hypothetical protein